VLIFLPSPLLTLSLFDFFLSRSYEYVEQKLRAAGALTEGSSSLVREAFEQVRRERGREEGRSSTIHILTI